jgi:hypothetical protein
MEARNDRYHDASKVTVTKANMEKTLISLKNDAPVRKVEGDKDSETPVWWKVELPNRMRHKAEEKRCCEDKPSR